MLQRINHVFYVGWQLLLKLAAGACTNKLPASLQVTLPPGCSPIQVSLVADCDLITCNQAAAALYPGCNPASKEQYLNFKDLASQHGAA